MGRANETSAASPGLLDLAWLRSEPKAYTDAVFACGTVGYVGVSGEACSGDMDRRLQRLGSGGQLLKIKI